MSIYIALGANLSIGNDGPAETFAAALDYLAQHGVKPSAMSALWQSPAWPPGSDQRDYINAVAKVSTKLGPKALLNLLHETEAHFGRERGEKNAARTLDLDLLDFAGRRIDSQDITIPHPRMLSRGFVLFPLAEVAPDWTAPKDKRAITDWIARLPLADVAPMRRLRP